MAASTYWDTQRAYRSPPQEWIDCRVSLPVNGVTVAVKIDDEKGCRNETTLKRSNNLWFTPDGSMYVYWTPTHWREI